MDGLGTWCDAERGAPHAEPSPRPLPAGFTPVSASRCVYSTRLVPGDGEWRVREEQQATGSLDALVRALRQPSREEPGAACPSIGYLPIVITLTDARGRSVTPAVPHEVCGAPLAAVPKAIQALSWHTVTRTDVTRVRTQLELDSGCSGAFKPMIAIEAADPARRSPALGPVFTTKPAALKVCRYEATGTLASAGRLTGTAVTRLLAAVAAAPGAGPCDRPRAPFAVVYPDDGGGGPYVMVELGGCYRFDDGAANLRQLDAGVAALLGG
jgi:hypothetical protein